MLYCWVYLLFIRSTTVLLLRLLASEMWHCTVKWCLDKCTASVFRVKEKAKQRTTWTSQTGNTVQLQACKWVQREPMREASIFFFWLLYRPISEPCFSCSVACLLHSSVQKMEAVWFSETLVDIHQTEWHLVTEDSTLCNHSCENLRPNKAFMS